MKGIFIFKRDSSGARYGVGTYISTLIQSVENCPLFHIYLVNYNRLDPDTIEYKENRKSELFTEVTIPYIKYNQNLLPEKTIVTLISPLIEKHGEVVFHTNFYEELDLIKELKRSYNYPVVTTMHFSLKNSIDEDKNIPLEHINNEFNKELQYYTLCDRIICLNQSAKDQLVNDYKITVNKIEIIKNGIEEKRIHRSTSVKKRLRRKLGFGIDEKLILFVGRLEKKKGVFNLLKVFECAYRKDNSLRLILVGEGNYAEFLAAQSCLYGAISLTGFISKDQLEEIYKVVDIGIIPSLNEQQPFVALEMINYEIPLILSDIQSLKDLLTKEECIHLSFNSSGRKLCESNAVKIINLIENPQKRKELSKNAKKRLGIDYCIEPMSEKMIAVYSLTSKSNE